MSVWYDNPALLAEAARYYGSYDAAARAIGGVHPSTLQKAAIRHGLRRRRPGPRAGEPNEVELNKLYERVYGHPED